MNKTQYTIVIVGGREKIWISDLKQIKDYSTLLKSDCFNLYHTAKIKVKKDDVISTYDLHTWLKEN